MDVPCRKLHRFFCRFILNQTKGIFIIHNPLDKLSLCHTAWKKTRRKNKGKTETGFIIIHL